MNQNPLLTLDALAPCGVVLPTEARAALDTSLTLKARELGVQAFLLWGKFTTSSGRDYYVARAYNGTKRVDGKVIVNPGNKFYYSVDCAEWLDLEPVDGKLGELCGLIDGAFRSRVPGRWRRRAIRARRSRPTLRAARHPPRGSPRAEFGNPPMKLIFPLLFCSLFHPTSSFHRPPLTYAHVASPGKRWLTGDPAHEYTVMEQPPTPDPDPVPDGDEPPPPPAAPDPIEHKLTELQRMAAMINRINAETACAPDGMYVTDAAGNYVAKPGFFVRYPDQLSSYVAPTGNLGKAAPGTWGLVWDSFKRVATLRSFAYPGFFACYSANTNTIGNLYFGNGLRNEEVGFV